VQRAVTAGVTAKSNNKLVAMSKSKKMAPGRRQQNYIQNKTINQQQQQLATTLKVIAKYSRLPTIIWR